MDFTCFLLLFLLAGITYWYLKRNHSHWEKLNVPSVPNPRLIFGHMLPVITAQDNWTTFVQRVYHNFNTSMVGFYLMQKPGLIIRDPELAKSVLRTNFSSFRANLVSLNEIHDPVMAKNPFFTDNAKLWKERRVQIANHLSSGRLKYLFVIVNEVCDKMSAFVARKIQEDGDSYECDLKQHFIRCTSEVVANAAFAIQGQSFQDNPDRLSFAKVAHRLLEPTRINAMKQALIFYLPSVANFLRLSFLQDSTDAYMRQNINAIIKQRQQTGEAPNDYLQFSIDSNSDLNGILGDVVSFYVDVYETSSTTLANIFYNLSKHPEIQTKLRDNVLSVLEKNDGKITYESLKSMTYLDQVIQESLRVFPPLGVQMKCCTEEITLTGSDGLSCHLKPGNPVMIPVVGFHADKKYWPNPEVFDPDRFIPENKANHVQCSYLPFGEGPRMCVGMRLGLMLVKQATASLITKYSIEYSSKTKAPLEIDPTTLITGFKGSLWARFKNLDQQL